MTVHQTIWIKEKGQKSKKLEHQGTQQATHPEDLESTVSILTSVFNEIASRSLGTGMAWTANGFIANNATGAAKNRSMNQPLLTSWFPDDAKPDKGLKGQNLKKMSELV